MLPLPWWVPLIHSLTWLCLLVPSNYAFQLAHPLCRTLTDRVFLALCFWFDDMNLFLGLQPGFTKGIRMVSSPMVHAQKLWAYLAPVLVPTPSPGRAPRSTPPLHKKDFQTLTTFFPNVGHSTRYLMQVIGINLPICQVPIDFITFIFQMRQFRLRKAT